MRNLMAPDQYHVEVRERLADLGISQRRFAKMAGISGGWMSMFKLGQRVGPKTRAKIEAAMARLNNG